MENTKTILAILMLWILIVLVAFLLSLIFSKDLFALRVLLLYPFCHMGVELTIKFIKE